MRKHKANQKKLIFFRSKKQFINKKEEYSIKVFYFCPLNKLKFIKLCQAFHQE